MKVFLGWSGDRSRALALALREWIPLVLHYARPWMSDTDIAAGTRWEDAIGKELEGSNFGIIGVTRQNMTSPWIHFEAGSLAKSLSIGRVTPLLLDLDFKDLSGPLAQFQAKKADRGGIEEVINSINSGVDARIPESRTKQLFEALWPQLEEAIGRIPKPPGASKATRSTDEVLEELVAGVRQLDNRLRSM